MPRFYFLVGEREDKIDVDVLKATFTGEMVTLEKFVNAVDSA